MIKRLLFSSVVLLTVVSVEASTGRWGVYLGGQAERNEDGEFAVAPQAFIPLDIAYSDREVIFIDLRGVVKTSDLNNTNIAFGYRNKGVNGQAFGINGAVDLTVSEHGNLLGQAGLGVEFLSRHFDAAANFYAPINTADIAGSGIETYARIVDNQFELVYQDPSQERARFGADLYLRARLPITQGLLLELTGGTFYYFATETENALYGAHIQAELRHAFDFFGLDASVAIAGGVRHTNTLDRPQSYVSLEFGVSLGGRGDQRGVARDGFLRSPMRDGAPRIAVKEGHSEIQVANGSTMINGQEYYDIFTLTANQDIVTEVANAGTDSIVVLKGDDGSFEITTGVQVQAGQVIIGEGVALVVKGPGGRQAVLLVGDDRVSVNNTSTTSDTFILSTDSLLYGVDINGGNRGVYMLEADGSSVVNVNIAQTAGDGIGVENSYDVLISDSRIENAGFSGVRVDSSHNVLITGTYIKDSFFRGIDISNSGSVTVKDSTIIGANDSGVRSENSLALEVEGSLVMDTGEHGVEAKDTNSVLVKNTTIINPRVDGVHAENVDELVVEDSHIDGNRSGGGGSGAGVYASSTNPNATVSIRGSVIENIRDGVAIYNDVDLYVDQVEFEDIGFGIYYNGTGDLVVRDSSIVDSDYGIIATVFTNNAVIENVDIASEFEGISFYGDSITVENSIIESSDRFGVLIFNASQVSVSDSVVSGQDAAISIESSDNILLANSYFLGQGAGIAVYDGVSVNISGNIIDTSGDMTFSQTVFEAVQIIDSLAVDISDNHVYNAEYGYVVDGSVDVSGSGNTAHNIYQQACFITINNSNVAFYVNSNLCSEL